MPNYFNMFSKPVLNKLLHQPTPFYYYDVAVLKQTLQAAKTAAERYNYHIHYAVKANANEKILSIIREYGFGVDCVSGNEIARALKMGFNGSKVAFAGVGKSDQEINLALDNTIFSFNCESIPELEVINQLAARKKKTARVALRINPNVNANTHKYITTGLEENKFGIPINQLPDVFKKIEELPHIRFTGIHFHIGSQITDLDSFKSLCIKANELQNWLNTHNIFPEHINLGGGLGIDYHEPDKALIPDFESFFKIFHDFLEVRPNQPVHFELGRSLVAQSGSLITKVLYVKNGITTDFAIVDAGFSDLIRPALYQAYHKIENISSTKPPHTYDVVGPICESSDCFAKHIELPHTQRGDLLAIRSAGAYGEAMASNYNLRDLPNSRFSDEL